MGRAHRQGVLAASTLAVPRSAKRKKVTARRAASARAKLARTNPAALAGVGGEEAVADMFLSAGIPDLTALKTNARGIVQYTPRGNPRRDDVRTAAAWERGLRGGKPFFVRQLNTKYLANSDEFRKTLGVQPIIDVMLHLPSLQATYGRSQAAVEVKFQAGGGSQGVDTVRGMIFNGTHVAGEPTPNRPYVTIGVLDGEYMLRHILPAARAEAARATKGDVVCMSLEEFEDLLTAPR